MTPPAAREYAVVSTTHLIWLGRWVEVKRTGDAWTFKTGRDAADWLLWPRAFKGSA